MYLSTIEGQQKQLHLLQQLERHSDPVLVDNLNTLRDSKGFVSSNLSLGPTSNAGFNGTNASIITRSTSTSSSDNSSNNSSPNHTHMNSNSDIQSLMNDIALPSPSVESGAASGGGRFNYMLNSAPGLASASNTSLNMNTNASTFKHLSSISSSNIGNATNNNGYSYANAHPNQLQHGLQYGETGIKDTSVELLATATSLSELRHPRTRSNGNDSYNNFSSNESCSSSSSNLSNNNNNNNNNSSNNANPFPSFTTRMKSVEEFKTNDGSSCNDNVMFNSPSFIGGMPFDSWRSSSFQERPNLAQQNEQKRMNTTTNTFASPSHYEGRSMNHNNNNRPPLDPAIIIGPLLNMGFNMLECKAAADAIRNISMSRNDHSHCHSSNLNNHSLSTKNLEGNLYDRDPEQFSSHHHQANHSRSYNSSSQQKKCEDVVIANSMNNLSLSRNSNQYPQGNADELTSSNGPTNSVWANADKMMSIRVPSVDGTSESDDGTIESEDKSSSAMGVSLSISNHHIGAGVASSQNRIQKLIRMLDIPPELNAFVFHCNAQTRDECLSRGLFG